MGRIVASNYEVEKKIGKGGAGVVYLAKHLGLNKKVVLKVDKRSVIKTRAEILRKEVDVLKDLSHTYIPQVYDFFEEDGAVCTVIEYIEGESFDQYLERGKVFSQKEVIKWAREILEALVYLHSRPPHGILHADIKPANIMLTSEGSIKLIDFNIALALGEEGAVKVGYSRGYASPEHYESVSLKWTNENPSNQDSQDKDAEMDETLCLEDETLSLSKLEDEEETGLLPEQEVQNEGGGFGETWDPGEETLTLSEFKTELLSDKDKIQTPASHLRLKDSFSNSGTYEKKRTLDVRSDIYSLGATLYHLLTGTRPSERSRKDLFKDRDDSQVMRIIQKAMQEAPENRYQTAEEMLLAFKLLHENDDRTKAYRRSRRVAVCALATLLVLSSLMTFSGLKKMQLRNKALVLTELSEEALNRGDVPLSINYALSVLGDDRGFFGYPDLAKTRKVLTRSLGLYDLDGGYRPYRTCEIPSEPLKTALSKDGKTLAVLYENKVDVLNTESGRKIVELKAEPSAFSDIVFADNRRLIYSSVDGVCAYDIEEKKALWTGSKATGLAISADGSTVAAVYKDDTHAKVYRSSTGEVIGDVSFGRDKQKIPQSDAFADPGFNLFELNNDGSLLAVSFETGGLKLYDTLSAKQTAEIYSSSEFKYFQGGFYKQYFAFSADGERSVFGVLDTRNYKQTGGFQDKLPFHVQVDETGIYVSNQNILVKIDPEDGTQQELAYTEGDILNFVKRDNMSFVTTTENKCLFFDEGARMVGEIQEDSAVDFLEIYEDIAVVASRNNPIIKLLKFYPEKKNIFLAYDATYPHHESRISEDGSTVMLYSYDRFRIYDKSGKIVSEKKIPDPEQVYDQQFYKDGGVSRMETLYHDGTLIKYSAKDGSVIEKQKTEIQNKGMEEFFTDKFRIEAPLHGTPRVYDKETNKYIRDLEDEADLTYVTQVDEYIITEYINSSGERYGLLLNGQLDTVALLPNLCDIVGKELVFDSHFGYLRKSRIYELPEILEMAEEDL